jgi:hypothetical protein
MSIGSFGLGLRRKTRTMLSADTLANFPKSIASAEQQ